MSVSSCQNDDITLAYDVAGAGAPLLLICGLSADRNFWSSIRASLTGTGFQTIVFDNRDVGRSGLARRSYGAADMARDAIAVLNATGLKRAHVLGHSLGGAIAQEMAIRAPDRVDRLVLANTFGRTTRNTRGIFDLLNSARRGLDDDTFLALLYRLGLGPDMLQNVVLEDVLNQVKATGPMQHRDGFLRQLAACLGVDTLDRTAAIKAPTLVLYAPHDAFVGLSDARALADSIDRAQLRGLGSGHCPMLEEPDAFVDLVSAFLNETDP